MNKGSWLRRGAWRQAMPLAGRCVIALACGYIVLLGFSLSPEIGASSPRFFMAEATAAQRSGAGVQTTSSKACLMHNGLAYGPFRDGQSPLLDIYPSTEQIQEDLRFVSKITKKIRTYGTKGTLSKVPAIAKDFGVSVAQGIYLSKDKNENSKAINVAIQLAKENLIDTIIVGNEELTGSLISKNDLLEYIKTVKTSVPENVRITTAETSAVWRSNLDLAVNVDFVMAHFYPFWEAHPIQGAMTKLLNDYNDLKSELKQKYPGRNLEVVVGETGWPSGTISPRAGLATSPENQRQFVNEFLQTACSRSIPFYVFEAFDEEWKWSEGASRASDSRNLPNDRTFSGRWVGSSWGLYDSNGKLKPHLGGLFDQPDPGSRRYRDIFVDGILMAYYDVGVDSSGKQRDWLATQEEGFRMSYPPNQNWGAVFITVGEPGPRPHPWKDFSELGTLSLELRGEKGGETVEIGVLNASDPATGMEKKVSITNLSTSYRTENIPLKSFASSRLTVPEDLRKLYVIVEFVFNGPKSSTVFVKNVRYKP